MGSQEVFDAITLISCSPSATLVRFVLTSSSLSDTNARFSFADSRGWMESDLVLASHLAAEAGVTLTTHVYITRDDTTGAPLGVEHGSTKDGDVESVDSQPNPKKAPELELGVQTGRPNLPDIVKAACASELGGRIAFAGMPIYLHRKSN